MSFCLNLRISTFVHYSKTEAVSCSYMHPTIKETLSQMPNLVVSRLVTEENDGKVGSHLVLVCVHV